MLLLVLALQQPVVRAGKDVADPGVIATGQRVTPAGVQAVFDGKVGGVRFGATSSEIWVAAPGNVVRLDWQNNRVVARARVPGRPGVFGVAVDPVTQRAFVSFVSNTPATRGPGQVRSREMAIVHVFDPDTWGDSVVSRANSGVLGDFMAGAPAIATQPDSASGQRAAVVPLPANDELAVLNANTGALVHFVQLGVEPIASAISADGRFAYVTVLGGAKPGAGDWAALQCCDARSEAVRVDARGIAQAGSVTKVDVLRGIAVKDIAVGRHPTAIVWDERGARAFVADGNSDTVSVIDTRTDAIATRIAIAPFANRRIGLAPTALALSPDARLLYVALGGVNAVAMYDVSNVASAKLLGLIPTAWYPASLDVSADGKYLAIGALLGVGSGNGKAGGSPGKTGRYVHAVRGSVNVVAIPSAMELSAYTTAVAENNRMTLASGAGAVAAPRRVGEIAARAVPEQPGDPSLIKHVVFIVKENRTYDQVLGDLGRGNGDSSLTIFGRDVTPNAHALSEQFVTLDHFFASGGNSADGHQWLTQANETEYPMWPLYYGRSYPSEGEDAMTYSSGGFLWEAAQVKGLGVSVFAEYAPGPKTNSSAFRMATLAKYREAPKDFAAQRKLLAARYNTRSDIPSLDKALVREYPGWTLEVPDVVKAGDILSHLAEWQSAGAMPNLVMVILPSDHTTATSAGWSTPKASVADNDYALGLIVEGLTHSKFWNDMAIMVVEDDAQDGVDHIDGHRTVALAISPYSRRGSVDSTFYSQPSMVRTIELMLGLPSMSIFDLVATDMRASFVGPNEKPDLKPYAAIAPKQSLYDVNQRVGAITGPNAKERREAARQSARMDFDGPDEAPSDLVNRILWHDARGWGKAYPGVRQS
ncbi:MAG TPA: alkaline phosphatase family protein, partial [Gemmatimonadaceae bacterium]